MLKGQKMISTITIYQGVHIAYFRAISMQSTCSQVKIHNKLAFILVNAFHTLHECLLNLLTFQEHFPFLKGRDENLSKNGRRQRRQH